MTMFKFEIKGDGRIKNLYATTEGGAKALKKELDRNGDDYTMASYATLYDLLKDLPEYVDDTYSDGEALDAVLQVVADIGL